MDRSTQSAPLLYQLHTRDWLTHFSQPNAPLCHLDEVPDDELDRLAALGFDWIYLLGVWQTGQAAAEISRTDPRFLNEYREALPGFQPSDITGSTFAITAYRVHADFGGPDALADIRKRLATRSLKLMLDFVPNHTAPDHQWVREHPDFYVNRTAADLAANPGDVSKVFTGSGVRILARGRDPYFAAWPDTLQLNYGNPALQSAMVRELECIARQCDGVRCDMAMLVLPEVFLRTWNISTPPFWPTAIPAARAVHPDFLFMAEVYWGLDRQLQQLGFDFTYDKPLYDLLLERNVGAVRDHLKTDPAFIHKSAHFLENHDEKRIAAQLPLAVHKAAAALTFLIPGLRFFHQGQLDGYCRKPSIHLGRRAIEPTNPEIHSFYLQLLQSLQDPAVQGEWSMLKISRAWNDDPTFDSIIGFAWMQESRLTAIAAVNYSDHDSRCYFGLPVDAYDDSESLLLEDLLGTERYVRPVDRLKRDGLYLALAPWAAQLFRVSSPATGS